MCGEMGRRSREGEKRKLSAVCDGESGWLVTMVVYANEMMKALAVSPEVSTIAQFSLRKLLSQSPLWPP